MSVSRTVFYCLFEKYVTPDNWNNLVKREKPSNHNYCLGTLAGATAWMPDASCPCSRAMHPAAPRNSVCPSCTLLMCSCKTRRGGQAQRARGSRHATAALVNEFDFFFFWPKRKVFWPITQISQQRILFWKCLQVFCKKSKPSVKKATTSHLPSTVKLLALQAPMANLLLLP